MKLAGIQWDGPGPGAEGLPADAAASAAEAALANLGLRDYQLAAIDHLRQQFGRGYRRVMLCAPTGAGKTHIAAGIVLGALQRGKRRIAFVADRNALVAQASDRLDRAGVQHGLWYGEDTHSIHRPVQICSAQTLARRQRWPWDETGRKRPPELAIVDEAHTVYDIPLAMLREAGCPVIGLSATPLTEGLGKHYQDVVNVESTRVLIDRGILVDANIWVSTEVDMQGAPVNRLGEWTSGTAAKRARPITGNIVQDWIDRSQDAYGGPVKTLVFGATVAHCEDLCREFQAAGYDFRATSYRDKGGEHRRANIADLEAGRCMGMASVEALAKGLDIPDIQFLVIARPLRKSLKTHLQILGRAIRAAAGKRFALVNDHTGNCLRFLHETAVFWETGCDRLDPGRLFAEAAKRRAKDRIERICPACQRVVPPGAGKACPSCGAELRARKLSEVETAPGKLQEIQSSVPPEERFGDCWPHVAYLALAKYPARPGRARNYARWTYRNLVGRDAQGRELAEAGLWCDPQLEAEAKLANRLEYARRNARRW